MRVAILVSAFLLASSLSAAEQSVSDLSWMSGCWAAVGKESGSEEHWMAPRGGSMLGMGRTVRNGKTAEYEAMRIEERAGGIFFVATPSGQSTAEFRLLSLDGRRVVFENREHDFPQRVIYSSPDEGTLNGRIEGTIDGKERGVDFPMRRSDCR